MNTPMKSQFQMRGRSAKPAIRVGVAGLIWHEGKLLIGQRKKEPHFGKWVLPGGGVHFGETFEDALRREMAEEASIAIVLGGLKTVRQIIGEGEHRIVIFFEGRLDHFIGGAMRAGSDLSQVLLADGDELRRLLREDAFTPTVYNVLYTEGVI